MELNAEWQKEAERIFEKDNPQDGKLPEWAKINATKVVTAYKQAVHNMLQNKIEKYTLPSNVTDEYKQAWYLAKTNLIGELLTELQTLKPTSND